MSSYTIHHKSNGRCTHQSKQQERSNSATLGVFIIRLLFHSRFLDMRKLKATTLVAPSCLYTISYPTHIPGIIVK